MNAQEIIASGLLELYVSGSLSTEEIQVVEDGLCSYPEVKREVEKIEKAYKEIAEIVSPVIPASSWTKISQALQGKNSPNKSVYIGWITAAACLAGIIWLVSQNSGLKDEIEITTTENIELKEQIQLNTTELASRQEFIDILRSQDYKSIVLPGNLAVAPDAFAKVYFNEDNRVVYIDTKGLPEAPEGQVYQAWSLTLNPLTPTSIGTLDDAFQHESGVYKFENIADVEAFGITLEPKGGSESPTLSQLYTLGAVSP